MYVAGGFVYGRRQGRDAQSGAAGQLAVHPHWTLWYVQARLAPLDPAALGLY